MRVPSFLRFTRSKAGQPQVPVPAAGEHLDAFLSEAGPLPPQLTADRKQVRSFPALLPIVATLAVIEAVPAGLWLYQTLAISEAGAGPSAPSETAAAPIVMTAPCEPPSTPAADASPPVSSQGTARATATATAGVAAAGRPTVAPGSVGGLIAVVAPVPMHIYARGRIVGTTAAETIMLPVGSHELEFVSEEAGYKTRRTVSVQAGRTATIRLEAPAGVVHVNAAPWAEVWIDNQRVGDTPIGNLQVAIGMREFVFRHPELGERRRTALVTLKEPSRITMDMRTK